MISSFITTAIAKKVDIHKDIFMEGDIFVGKYSWVSAEYNIKFVSPEVENSFSWING